MVRGEKDVHVPIGTETANRNLEGSQRDGRDRLWRKIETIRRNKKVQDRTRLCISILCIGDTIAGGWSKGIWQSCPVGIAKQEVETPIMLKRKAEIGPSQSEARGCPIYSELLTLSIKLAGQLAHLATAPLDVHNLIRHHCTPLLFFTLT